MKAHVFTVLTLAAASMFAIACEVPPQTTEDDAGTDAGTVDAGPADTDLALVKFTASGTLDTSFGTGGTARLDLSTGSARDTVYSVAKDAQGRVIVFGTMKGDGQRTDADRVVARVSGNGQLDTTFATNGVYRLNVQDSADAQRNGIVQADGKIVSAGYSPLPTGVGSQVSNSIVLSRLNSDGTPDTTFGTNGIVVSNPFQKSTGEWGLAEAYGVCQQSTGSYVTAGYGREASSGTVDVLSFRFTDAGVLDNTYGTSGKVVVDFLGDNDRGRNIAVLPDDRMLVVGSATTASSNIDALVMLFTADGALDTTFSTDGKETIDFGRSDDAFFGAVATATHLIAVGYTAGSAGGQTQDEDATIFIQPLNGGAKVSRVVALSDTGNDRLFSATLDGNGKIVAAGFIDEGGDTRMAVARFNLDGTLDTTFGSGGIAKVNVQTGGKVETARGVVVMGDGSIVLGGNVEH